MGLFGNLFEKKECAICGGEIGLLGNRKLEDGNLCKNCAGKLSPFFSERRHSTVAQIQEQLDYREANKEAVEAFKVSRTFNAGYNTHVMVDEEQGNFVVTSSRNWREANPDVIPCSAITNIEIKQNEHKTEITYEDAEGNKQSYTPPRYEVKYDFDMIINVDCPYFDEIRFDLSAGNIDSTDVVKFTQVRELGISIKEGLEKPKETAAAVQAAANAPKTAVNCPFCGATTIPDENGRCEWCGGAVL